MPFDTITSVRHTFDYVPDASMVNRPYENQRTSIVNAFYVANRFHDIMYHYGFTEEAGNYQKNNFKRGGKGGDAIKITILSNQATSSGAFFIPSEDGIPGQLHTGVRRMRDMLTGSQIVHDLALDNNILIHELTHGVSERLVGGPSTADCLSDDNIESAALGEAFSDTIAWAFAMKSTDGPTKIHPMAAYAAYDTTVGIRDYPYSTDFSVNPLMFADLTSGSSARMHENGAIFATMLYEVYWSMVARSGFSPDVGAAVKEHGNTRFIQIVIDSLKMMPCNPRFIDARNALLAAEKANYNSLYRCDIWKAFAKRGLGSTASYKRYNNNRSVPTNCN